MKSKGLFVVIFLGLLYFNVFSSVDAQQTAVQPLSESQGIELMERTTSILEGMIALLLGYSLFIGVAGVIVVIYAKKHVKKFKKNISDTIQDIQALSQGFNDESQKKISYIEGRLKTFENDFSIFVRERKKSYHIEIDKIKRDIRNFTESSSELFLSERPDAATSEKLFRLTTMLEFLEGIGDELKFDEYLIMGKYYFFEDNFDKTIDNFEKASKLVGNSADIWNLKGAVYYKFGKFEQELVCYEKALSISPDNIKVMTNKAAALMSVKSYDTSEMLLRKVLTKDDSYFFAWWLLGLVFWEKNRFNEAEKAFLKVVSLEPSKSEAYYKLASIYALNDNWIDCVKYLEKAVKLNIRYKFEAVEDNNFGVVRNYSKFQELTR